MIRVVCRQCGASAYTDNGVQSGDALNCSCCQQQHSHDAAANACPGADLNHPGVPCSNPDPLSCTVVTPPGESCPGGHCGLGVPDCTVCRPVIITSFAALPGV